MRRISGVAALSKQRRNDLLLLLGIATAIAVFATIYMVTRSAGDCAIVLQNGNEIARYSLSEDARVPVSVGDTVTNVLVIEDGKAHIEEANCPDQICVKHRAVSKAGETIVCLPNELVIKIEASAQTDAPDMVV